MLSLPVKTLSLVYDLLTVTLKRKSKEALKLLNHNRWN